MMSLPFYKQHLKISYNLSGQLPGCCYIFIFYLSRSPRFFGHDFLEITEAHEAKDGLQVVYLQAVFIHNAVTPVCSSMAVNDSGGNYMST
jgi:hypothetical protein